jgi:hypothetical protein
MAVDVTVDIPKLGSPDVSLTARELGQRSRPSGHGTRASDVWEIVRLDGKPSLDPQEVAQIGKCRFVKNLSVNVPFTLEYFVAKDLQDNVDNAVKTQAPKGEQNFHRWLLQRVKGHAAQHYDQYVKVITAWKADIKQDLEKTLPTEKRPTSLQELEIKEQIGALVSDWIAELDFRLKQDAFQWEKTDYPHIEKQMKSTPGATVFMPTGLSLPPAPQSPASRRKVTFPPCRPDSASRSK